jgi:hypothetical protein
MRVFEYFLGKQMFWHLLAIHIHSSEQRARGSKENESASGDRSGDGVGRGTKPLL